MLRTLKLFSMTALIAVMTSMTVKADIEYDYDNNNNYDRNNGYEQVKIDRYLDVEVWTNHTDNEFYEGDNIVVSFRANRDAFVAIYTVDSRGRVNLLFPSSPNDNNFIEGGETYRLPDHQDDFDFVVSGPEGVETIQIIASKERFPIPDWYPTSGLINDWDDRHEFMDYINSRYFVRYDGQRFAFDRSSVYVNEWEDDYYRPIYYPSYPSWTVAGNVYIDYPYGGSVYINGIYWGIAPLYIPRIYVGWHTFTVYDPWGHCWENDIHVTRYNTVVLNRTVINTSPTVRSKYKEVRTAGYRNPVTSGYPKYKKTNLTTTKPYGTRSNSKIEVTKKRYARGSTEIVKTKRGYETTGKTVADNKRSTSRTTYDKKDRRDTNSSSSRTVDRRKGTSSSDRYKQASRNSTGSTDAYKRTERKSTGSSETYKRSSGKSTSRKTSTYDNSRSSKSSSSKKTSKSSSKVEKQSKKESASKSSSNSGSYKKSDNSSKQSKSSGSTKSSSSKSSSDKSSKKKR